MAIPKISERAKIDIGLIGTTLSNANATGDYYDMRGYRKAIAICLDGASAVNKTTKVEFLQATAKAGTNAKVVKQSNSSTGTESSATNTAAAAALSDVTECTLTLSSAANGETVTINGLVFTAHTNTTTASKREFKIDGTDAQDATALAGLINNATYGVPGVTCVDGGDGALTLTATEAGGLVIDVSTDAVTHIIPAITKQVIISEIDIGDMDHAGGFYWLAVKVTKAGNGIVAVTLIREPSDYVPVQAVAAATVL